MQNIRNQKLGKINEKTLLATVDIGKNTMMGYWRCLKKAESKPFEFFNNGRGFSLFWEKISKAMKERNLEEVVVGFESTGCYGEPFVHYLKKRPVRLVQVNPLHTKRLKELQGNSPNKTDKKDPKVIADIIELGHSLTLVVPEGSVAELRRLTHARERCLVKRTALLNQLQDIVFLLFPEFLQIMKDIKTKTAQHLLRGCPTPQGIIGYGVEALGKTMRKISCGKIREDRAKELFKAAWQSVGLRQGQESLLLEAQHLQEDIDSCDAFISVLEEKISFHLKEIPYSRFILSIKGVGEVTAAGIIGEVGDFNQFGSIAEITKLAGLDLFEISSGKHKGNCRISKRGRSFLRKLLFFASLNVVREGGILHEKYHQYLDRGMLKKKALVAIARKLLGIIFSLVRNHKEFDKGYDKTPALLQMAA